MSFPTTLEQLRAAGYSYAARSKCRTCQADLEWWTTPRGYLMPMEKGTAKPHWASCPQADQHRKPKPHPKPSQT